MSILAGKIPYVDFWDHKGPIIYYINALGELITNGSNWGVWCIEIVSLFVCCILIYNTFMKKKNIIAIISGIIFFLLGFNLFFSGGNQVEEYNILLQCLALWLAIKYDDNNKGIILIGVFAALSLLLRANNIGFFIAIFLQILITENGIRSKIKKVSFLFVGFMSTIAFYSLFLILSNSFSNFIDQAFLYNFFYVGVTLTPSSFVKTIIKTLIDKWIFFILPFISWIGLALKKKTKLEKYELIILLDFPLEIILVSISGRNFAHYNLLLILSSCILVISLIDKLVEKLYSYPKNKIGPILLSLFLSFIFVLWIANKNSYQIRAFSGRIIRNGFEPIHSEIEKYIEDNTSIDQTVLVWGTQTTLNYISNRFSPSPFSYRTPLLNEKYCTPELISEFLFYLEQTPPELIVDTRNPFPISKLKLEQSNTSNYHEDIARLEEFLIFVEENYLFETTIDNDYDVLKLKR